MVYQATTSEPTLPPAVAGPAFLQDGTEVWVRPVQAGDRGLLREFVEVESPDPLDLRYLSALRAVLISEALPTPVPEERLCLVVLGDRGERVAVLGIGEYLRLDAAAGTAEVAFLVAGPFRGRGIATLLLARLARAARSFGILRFEARVRPESPEISEVFRSSGLPGHADLPGGEPEVCIPLTPETGRASVRATPTGPGPLAGRLGSRPSVFRSRE